LPVYSGERYLWDLPDPAGLPVEAVRTIRDEIARCVRCPLADELAAFPPPGMRIASPSGACQVTESRWDKSSGEMPRTPIRAMTVK
jgi:hypothetical protein